MDKDLVEVIRCKDCKHCRKDVERIHTDRRKLQYYCDVGFYVIEAEEFCSKAEKKEKCI